MLKNFQVYKTIYICKSDMSRSRKTAKINLGRNVPNSRAALIQDEPTRGVRGVREGSGVYVSTRSHVHVYT